MKANANIAAITVDIERFLEDFEVDCAFVDYDVDVPRKKNRADILTVIDAIKRGKSSKAHKMAPRECKRDRTKTKEAKKITKEKLHMRGIKV